MNSDLPKACQVIQDDFDAYLSGETGMAHKEEIRAHLESCEHCSSEFQVRLKLREGLKGAVQRTAVPPFLQTRIRSALAGKKAKQRMPRIWIPAFGLAAALAIVALAIWVGRPAKAPWEMARSDQDKFIQSLYGQVAEIMRVGLGDHLHCAYFRKFPGDAPTPEELAEKIGPEFAPLLTMVRENVPSGHQLLAHQCVFKDRKFIHIALEDRGKLLSLVITRKEPGESFRGEDISRSDADIYRASVDRFSIAGFEAGDYLAFVVSDHNQHDNFELAVNLALPIQTFLGSKVALNDATTLALLFADSVSTLRD